MAAAVVIGIEPTWTNRVADGIAQSGKPVARLALEGRGDLAVVAEGARHAARFLQDASETHRTPVERSEILLSIKCGSRTPPAGSAPTPQRRCR